MKSFHSTFFAGPSKIEGKGCFTSIDLEPGMVFPCPNQEIGEAEADYHSVNLDDRWFAVGGPFRYVNHDGKKPLAEMFLDETYGVCLRILQWVKARKEVTMHYGDDWC